MILNRSSFNSRLFGLVGYDQTTDPSYPALTPSLLESRSGRIVNNEHSLLSIENIDQSTKNFAKYQYTAYDGATTYQLGDKVSESGTNYEYVSTDPSSGNTPPNATYWKEIDNLSDYLTKAMIQGQNEMIDRVFDEKKIRQRAKSIYDNVFFFDGTLNRRNVVENNDYFCGIQIELYKTTGLITFINSIAVALKGGNLTELNLELWHESQNEKLDDITISVNDSSQKWTNVNKILRYFDYTLGITGGKYYLGYRQSSLSGDNAIKYNVKSALACRCDRTYSNYKNWSKYADAVGFYIPESEMMGTPDFDNSKIITTPENNFGLNMNFVPKCDLENFLIEQEGLLAEALSLSTAMVLMRSIANSTRKTNANSNIVAELARKEIYQGTDANGNKVKGNLYDRWITAIKAVSFDFSNLGDCLSPENGVVSVNTRNYTVERY